METTLASAIYIALTAFLIVWLSLKVIGYRHRLQVNLGDGDRDELRLAIAAQLNAIEYIPIALLLLVVLELNGAPVVLIHAFGIALLTGRLLHAKAMLSDNLSLRVRGMQITLFTIIFLGIANLLWFAYGLFAI
jgi:uncharacterized membrane protein YecN with MAPEG domain